MADAVAPDAPAPLDAGAGAPAAPTAVATADPKFIPVTYVGQLEPNYYCRAWNGKRAKYCRARSGWGTAQKGAGRCKMHGGVQVDDPRVRSGRYRHLAASPRLQQLVAEHLDDPDPLNVLPELAAARALLQDWIERYSEFTAALTAWHDTWEGKYTPIGGEEKQALLEVLDEYEAQLTEGDPTDRQQTQLALARAAVAFLALPQVVKPRQLLDVSDAIRHVDVISKVIHRVEMLRARGTITYEQLRRFMLYVDRVLDTRVDDVGLRRRIREDLLAARV